MIRSAEIPQSTELHFAERVLFLSCPTGTYCREDRCQSFFDPKLIPTMRQPLEECESGGAIRAVGGKFTVIDAPALGLDAEETLSRVRAFSPEIVVLAVTFGSLESDLVWAKRLKAALPSVFLTLRGAPNYVYAETILEKYPEIDFLIVGDYEIVFSDILTLGYQSARGVIFRRQDASLRRNPVAFSSNLDDLPLPDRSGIDPSKYVVRGTDQKQATIRVQRGCPFPCTYCLVHSVSGNKPRHRSPESICREICTLQSEGYRFFYLRAETFSVDRDWAISLCTMLAERCPGIHWVTTTRVECVDDEVIAAMKAAGCYGISFGVDVGSETIGRRVKKVPQPERARQAMRACDRHGVVSLAYIMIGFLWETRETLKETKDFLREIRPDLLTVHFAHPYPGTPYYQAVREAGLGPVSPEAQAAPALELEELSRAELLWAGKRLLVWHYLRPSVGISLSRKLMSLGLQRFLGQARFP